MKRAPVREGKRERATRPHGNVRDEEPNAARVPASAQREHATAHGEASLHAFRPPVAERFDKRPSLALACGFDGAALRRVPCVVVARPFHRPRVAGLSRFGLAGLHAERARLLRAQAGTLGFLPVFTAGVPRTASTRALSERSARRRNAARATADRGTE